MSFVNDYLTAEEKKKFEKYQIKYAPKCTNSHKILGTEERIKGVLCTIDRERKMYLFDCGNNYRLRLEKINRTNYFALVLEEDIPYVAYIGLVKHYGNTETDGYELYWQYEELDNKSNMSDKEILCYVKEALCVYGLDGEPQSESSIVKFEF